MSVRSLASERRDLARRLRAAAEAIGTRSIEAMYRDPFWMARFGERGRAFAKEDGRRHVQYLAEAVETAYDAPFCAYARWLQSVLTSRGMCSLHIHQNFQRLEDAIAPDGEELRAAASPYLEAGRTALLPPHPTAAALHTIAVSRPPIESAMPFVDDPAYLLSYLADAINAGAADAFTAHVTWVCAEASRQGAVVRRHFERVLTEVPHLIEGRVDGEAIAGVTDMIATARGACVPAAVR